MSSPDYSFRSLRVRPATREDEPFLWRMLYYAAHMDGQGLDTSAARTTPAIAMYVAGWGRDGDLGFIAVDTVSNDAIGAAWLRQFSKANPAHAFIEESIPELVIAVVPTHIGRGIGTALLKELLAAASQKYRGVSLNVRQCSPAVRLYERLGFRRIPDRELVNRVGGISLVMEFLFDSEHS